MERLLDAGALDVTLTPVQMKKNRPGTMLTVIAKPEDRESAGAAAVRRNNNARPAHLHRRAACAASRVRRGRHAARACSRQGRGERAVRSRIRGLPPARRRNAECR